MSFPPPHRKQVEDDLKAHIAQVMREDPNLTPEEALTRVAAKMLQNNPFVPPKGCPVNTLPNEILAYIFFLGWKMEEERPQGADDDEGSLDGFEGDLAEASDDESDDDASMDVDNAEEDDSHDMADDWEDDNMPLPFQVLVSHVCSLWRQAALNEPTLWTAINFKRGHSLDAAKAYIERSKGLPLDIEIDASFECGCDDAEEELYEVHADGTATIVAAETSSTDAEPEAEDDSEDSPHDHKDECLSNDEVVTILDIITPQSQRWRSFTVYTSFYETMFTVLKRLKELPEAPLLQVLHLYERDGESEGLETGTFQEEEFREAMLFFNGNAPKLNQVALWGVHVDWEASLPLLSGLHELELSYLYNDVRPSFETFATILKNCPELKHLSLCGCGPKGTKEDWGLEAINLPSVTVLALSDHEVGYITQLLPYLNLHSVRELHLDFDGADFTSFVEALVQPHNGQSKTLLEGLEVLEINGLPSNKACHEPMLKQLSNLKALRLNSFSDDETHIFEMMMASTKGASMYCPSLEAFTSSNLKSPDVRKFLEARKKAGKPIKKLLMSCDDEITAKDKKWFDANLEEFDTFVSSDYEDDDDAMVIGESDSSDEDM